MTDEECMICHKAFNHEDLIIAVERISLSGRPVLVGDVHLWHLSALPSDEDDTAEGD